MIPVGFSLATSCAVKYCYWLLLTRPEIFEAIRASQAHINVVQAHDNAEASWEICLGLSVDDVEFLNLIKQGKWTLKQTITLYHLLNLPSEWRATDKARNVLFVCNANIFNNVFGIA